MTRLLSLLALLTLFGCSGDNGPVAPEPATQNGQPSAGSPELNFALIELGLDQTASAGELQVSWLDIEDSRCPTGALCIWEGQASTRLNVSRTGQTAELLLTLRNDLPTVVGSAFGYTFRLLAVDPYPRAGIRTPRDQYRALIEILPIDSVG